MKETGKNMSIMLTGVAIGAVLTGGSFAAAAGVVAEPTWQPIFVDGRQVQMTAYNIAGHNYEERTRTVTAKDEMGNGVEEEETYTVAIPITDLAVVYRNISSAMGVEVTVEQQANADNIYSLIVYGLPSGSSLGEGFGGPVMSVDGFCSPLGAGWQARVTSDFGYRICPYHGRELHSGLDMGAPTGTPIRAALAGKVVKSYYSISYGNYTLIDHGNGMTTAYAHQSKRLVKVGDTVEAGEVIGLVGSTGNYTGPHLHFEVRVDGNLQDPKLYLP